MQISTNQVLSQNEEKITYLTEKEEKTSERYKLQSNENCLLKSEIKNMLLKIQYIEKKTEEKLNFELILTDLQKDYDNIVKEKSMIIQKFENQLFYLKEENRDSKESLNESQRTISNLKKEFETMEKDFYFLEKSKLKLEKENEELKAIDNKKNSALDEKSRKIDHYCNEISLINNKILEFNMLMEKLIQENQRLNIIANENQKSDYYSLINKDIASKSKKGEKTAQDFLKMSNTVKYFRNDGGKIN